MTNCNPKNINLPACKRRKVEAEFNGGDVTSNGGILLVRQADRLLGLTKSVGKVLPDTRDPSRIQHSMEDLLRQRVYGLALGYEDLNDHHTLRQDLGFQTGVDRDRQLASSATLCRFENGVGKEIFWRVHEIMVDQFISSHKHPPTRLILDFDATDDPVHGQQNGRFFHGYYRHYCFLPLYVFCGDHPLISYLRSANIDGAKHSGPILKWLVQRLRQDWPKVQIILRGDGGFCRHRLLSWCERNNVDFIVGMAKNSRLEKLADSVISSAKNEFEKSNEVQRKFGDFSYAAGSWKKRERRCIVRAQHSSKGKNPRFIITSLPGDPQELYDQVYCARGEMENRIKEQQLCLFADRTSCHDWWANQFRLLLSTIAYILLENIRRLGLSGTKMANARCDTIRLKLLKIGAVIIRNTRRIRFMLSSACPNQDLFFQVLHRFTPQ